MAFGDWDEVIQKYEDIYLNSKYAYHAKAMIELIPSIRTLPEFDGIMPDTSHGTLFFSVANKVETVNIWYSEEGIYTVYLAQSSDGEINSQTATAKDVLSILKTAVKQLKSIDDKA